MQKKRKAVYAVVMGGLTSIACSGCIWQYRRYKQSRARWDKINEQIGNFTPLKVSKIPWTLADIKEWQYNLVSFKGNFVKEKTVLVNRMQDARMGFLVVKPFKEENDNFTMLVNCGWIPKEMKENPPAYLDGVEDDFEIIGLLKRDENLEIKRTDKMYPRLEELFNLIDNEQIGEHFGLDFSSSNGAYLELIKDSEDDGREELYPVTPTSANFSRPYLTPRRHIEYSTFWGLTACIGFGSILRVLRM